MALGASDTTEFDKMMGALGMLSGSKAGAQKVFDAASAMYAPVEDANPWEASLRYFLEMGKQASQPGATVLGSAVGSGLVPLDYLTAKKKEKRDRDQKVASTAFSLAPTLKPKAATYRDPKEYMIEIPVLDDNGKPTGAFQPAYRDFLTAKGFADLQKQGARFKSVDKTTGTGSTTFGQYLLTTPEAIAAYKAQGSAFTLTPEQEAGTAPVTISANVLRTAGGFTKYEKAGSGAADDLKTFALLNPDDLTKIREVVPNASIDGMGNILLTDAESKKVGVRQYIGEKKSEDTVKKPESKVDARDGKLRYTANPPIGKSIGDEVFEGVDIRGFSENQLRLADSLRDDLTKQLKPFEDISSAFKQIAGFYDEAQRDNNPVSDYSLAVQYAKVIDPGTAAREGEVAAIATAGSLSGAFRAALTNALMGTGKLSPRMRASIYNNALKIYGTKLPGALSLVERYETQSNLQADGLFNLVGLNVNPSALQPIGEAGYEPKDLDSLTETAEDSSTYNFPPDFDFSSLSRENLLGLLRLPDGSLDERTLTLIDAALGE